MRFRETRDKLLDKDREKAKKFYDRAFSLYSMFWAINFEIDEGNEFIEKQKTEHDLKPENTSSSPQEASENYSESETSS